MTLLSHPSLCPCLGALQHGDDCWLVMPKFGRTWLSTRHACADGANVDDVMHRHEPSPFSGGSRVLRALLSSQAHQGTHFLFYFLLLASVCLPLPGAETEFSLPLDTNSLPRSGLSTNHLSFSLPHRSQLSLPLESSSLERVLPRNCSFCDSCCSRRWLRTWRADWRAYTDLVCSTVTSRATTYSCGMHNATCTHLQMYVPSQACICVHLYVLVLVRLRVCCVRLPAAWMGATGTRWRLPTLARRARPARAAAPPT